MSGIASVEEKGVYETTYPNMRQWMVGGIRDDPLLDSTLGAQPTLMDHLAVVLQPSNTRIYSPDEMRDHVHQTRVLSRKQGRESAPRGNMNGAFLPPVC